MGILGKYIGAVVCTDCPCLNTDQERGSDCNLGHDSDYINLSGNLSDTRSWAHISTDCGLELIKHSGGEFRPVKIKSTDV